jgi:type IV secretory pathway VirB4 component
MLGTEILIIDPEKEFERLCEAVDGAYITFSQDKGSTINPFELSGLGDPNEDELRMKILSLHGFFKVLFGGLNNIESSILDRALILTYRERGITTDPDTQKNADPPLLEDLYKILQGMAEPEGRELAKRLEKYIVGSAAGVFNEKSNVSIKNPFTVFSLRDLQEELRPMAMYLMLDYIWTKIKREQKRRLLLIDEAWLMMQNEDSAKFVYSIAKRARKYYLGLTTITQDVEDFLESDYGKAIVTNSSIQILLKQSAAAVDRIQNIFNLSDGEKQFLLQCERGEGLFFAGSHHVAINIISSIGEHLLITSDPREVEAMHAKGMDIDDKEVDELSNVFDPVAAKKTIAEYKSKAKDSKAKDEGQNTSSQNQLSQNQDAQETTQ